MNDAYDDLKKQMDLAKAELPDDADDPIMLELNTSLKPNVIMAVSHGEDDDLYNYVITMRWSLNLRSCLCSRGFHHRRLRNTSRWS